jgi:uncharacterized membrane protein YeaQ/YmgE (transglycosylase-associated protein family)
MNGVTLLVFLLVGVLAGWFAGKGYGPGLIGDIVLGVIGAFIGGGLFGHLHIVRGPGLLDDSVGATVGAIILLIAVRLMRRSAWRNTLRSQTRNIRLGNAAAGGIPARVDWRGGSSQA